jgi:hypothetical protein
MQAEVRVTARMSVTHKASSLGASVGGLGAGMQKSGLN